MVLYPLNSPKPSVSLVPAWDAIFRAQNEDAGDWWLVAQPDHAELAGELAARLASPHIPRLDAEVLRAIALHDDGWAAFDSGAAKTNGKGRPLSFLEVSPADFLCAWRDSIERAQQVAPIGGILVSEHFCRLGHSRLQSVQDAPQDAASIRNFLDSEAERQHHLARRQPYRPQQILVLVDVLQFCDLFSLFLCCGAGESVEFPQRFEDRTFSVWRDGEMCRTDPPLFGDGMSLAVQARRFHSSRETEAVQVPLLLR